jgi:hypothetical protein
MNARDKKDIRILREAVKEQFEFLAKKVTVKNFKLATAITEHGEK